MDKPARYTNGDLFLARQWDREMRAQAGEEVRYSHEDNREGFAEVMFLAKNKVDTDAYWHTKRVRRTAMMN